MVGVGVAPRIGPSDPPGGPRAVPAWLSGSVITHDDLLRAFDRNRRIIRLQTEGLDTSDSLIQPPFGGNCMNWVIGHVVVHRGKALTALGSEPVLDEETVALYDAESNPITGDGPGVLRLDALLETLEESQERLAASLPSADFDAEIESRGRTTTLGSRVHFWYFHDTYHTGQTELLRGLAGRTDKVI